MKRISLFLGILTLFVIIFFASFYLTYAHLVESLKSGKGVILQSLDIYSPYKVLNQGQWLLDFENDLKLLRFRKRDPSKKIFPNDYSYWPKQKCKNHFDVNFSNKTKHCLLILTTQLYVIGLTDEKLISDLFHKSNDGELKEAKSLNFYPQILAQVVNSKFLLQNFVKLSEIPLYCIHATMAAEDQTFLDHRGFSAKGILRALGRNIIKRKYAEGGSTITQQLVKNYFLTKEKTLKRKFKEIILSIILELKLEKDKILEAYLNILYMGQSGPYEIRGFPAASQFYFGKSISDLNLSECAFLAGIIKSPGGYNPFKNPHKSLKRRQNILSQMKTAQWISLNQYKKASISELPQKNSAIRNVPFSAYLSQNIMNEVKRNYENLPLKVFTNIEKRTQVLAERALTRGIQNLENRFPKLKEKTLQGSLISVHIPTGKVIAMVGGRDFRISQFDRVLNSKRQIGSLMKPFVFLTGFYNPLVHPLIPLQDTPFTYKYDNQVWKPHNFENRFFEEIPLFASLIYSLNASTSRFALEKVGLHSIISLFQNLGLKAKVPKLPSSILGAFELSPYQVAQAYLPLATQGVMRKLQFIEKITTPSGKEVWKPQTKESTVFEALPTALTLSVLKQNMVHGTGQLAYWHNYKRPSAGKTGTTNQSKDTWFAGFTPDILTVVWVGYDDNTPLNLTGSSAALPIWIDYMKKATLSYPKKDFSWPEDLQQVSLAQNIKESKIKEMVHLHIRKEHKKDVLLFLNFWFQKRKNLKKK